MKQHFVSLIYFFLAALLITYPLLLHLTDRLPGLGDELLITWILNWNIHALFSNPLHIFHANIFFPYQNTLAYSDVFFTSTILGLLPALFIRQPAFIYNFTLLFSLVSLGFCTYLLVFHVTKNLYASVISGTLMAFSTFTMTRLSVLQLIGIEWVPLSLLFFIIYLEKKQFRSLVFAAIFFVIQIYNSFLPGYFLLFCYICITGIFLLQKKISLRLFLTRKVFLLSFLAILSIIPLGLPYFFVSREFAYSRDIRDAIHFGNRPEYTFYPSDKTRLKNLLLSTVYSNDTGPYKYEGYIGFTFFILFLFVFIYRLVIRKKSPGTIFTAFSVIGIGGYVLSLGPALQWGGHVLKFPFLIPLPYALGYYLIPGFNGMRNSARWEYLSLFAITILIGIVLSEAWKKQPRSMQFFLTAVICLVTIVEYPFPMPLEQVATKEQFPAVYSDISHLPENAAIVELPLYSWRMKPYASEEFLREYYSVSHFHPMVNGYSGFSPLAWEKQAEDLMLDFPDALLLERMRNHGVSYVILHKDQYDLLEKNNYQVRNQSVTTWKRIQYMLIQNPAVKLVSRRGNVFIYELL
jgi:hypothetical protein